MVLPPGSSALSPCCSLSKQLWPLDSQAWVRHQSLYPPNSGHLLGSPSSLFSAPCILLHMTYLQLSSKKCSQLFSFSSILCSPAGADRMFQSLSLSPTDSLAHALWHGGSDTYYIILGLWGCPLRYIQSAPAAASSSESLLMKSCWTPMFLGVLPPVRQPRRSTA